MQEIDVITEIRGFNRFYTNVLGLLDQHILNSGYSLTEARVLFEISKTDCCTANQLCSILEMDRSYMSRVIRKFERDGLIIRHTDDQDGRNLKIHLTEKGNAVFQELNNRSNEQIANIIAKLNSADCEELIHAMRTVKKHISLATKNILIRPFRESDVAYVIDRQLSLYQSERHFTTDIWKKYLTQGVLELIGKFDAERDCVFILECNGSPAGCIAITHAENGAAQLRYFLLEPEMRGLGMGTALLNKALDFCREKKYSHVFLWTVSAQETARKLYGKAGFARTETGKNDSWGAPVLEEKWELDL